ncbi:hypothetical protein ACSV5G_20340 [Agrobacterium cavarae]|uniref:hypothetical protein n=1 Tax=Agrobacterium cavarae TaxID=2528239 RepID=UPI003FCF7893
MSPTLQPADRAQDGLSLHNYARFLGDAFDYPVLVNTAKFGVQTIVTDHVRDRGTRSACGISKDYGRNSA